MSTPDKEEANPLLDSQSSAEVESTTSAKTKTSQSKTCSVALATVVLLSGFASQALAYIHYERPLAEQKIREESNDGKKMVTDEEGTSFSSEKFLQVIPYACAIPASAVILLVAMYLLSKPSSKCLGSTWAASKCQILYSAVCLLLIPFCTTISTLKFSGSLDDYFIVTGGGLQRNTDSRVRLPRNSRFGAIEFVPYTVLDMNRGTYFEGKLEGAPYVACAVPIVHSSASEIPGNVTSLQNEILYWSSSCASTSQCCKDYHASKGKKVCDRWKNLGKYVNGKLMYGLLQPSLPCPTQAAKNAASAMYKMAALENSLSLEVTDNYAATTQGHLKNGVISLGIPVFSIIFLNWLGLAVILHIK